MDAAWSAWSSWSECVSCINEDVTYKRYDVNDGFQGKQPDVESCLSFCRTNHPSATYFSWHSPQGEWEDGRGACYCMTSNSDPRKPQVWGWFSGEVSCKIQERKGKRSRTRVCGNEPLNGGMPCHAERDADEEIEECQMPTTTTTTTTMITTPTPANTTTGMA